jgi:hypothetical protein
LPPALHCSSGAAGPQTGRLPQWQRVDPVRSLRSAALLRVEQLLGDEADHATARRAPGAGRAHRENTGGNSRRAHR